MAEPGSPLWWLDRLDQARMHRNIFVSRYDRYYRGEHPLAYATEQFRLAFGHMFSAFSDNWMALVVDAVRERLTVTGFSLPDGQTDDTAWRFWQANQLDAESQIALTEAIKSSEASIGVWPVDGRPKITVEDPEAVIVAHEPGDRRRRRAALKVFLDEWTGDVFANVYLPKRVWKFRRIGGIPESLVLPSGSDPLDYTWAPRTANGEEPVIANPLGVVPLVPLLNNPRLRRDPRTTLWGQSELDLVTANQDAVNKLVADLILTSDAAGYPAKWATGVDVPRDPQSGQPVPSWKLSMLKIHTASEPDAQFGAFPAADLKNNVAAIENRIQAIASQSRTPPHYFYLKGEFPSGEALAVDTPVQTPVGLRPIGGLVAGDEVFDERGQVQTVKHAFAALRGRPCYRVTFDDGTAVIADAGHRWLTTTWADRRRSRAGSVVTTEQMRATLHARTEAGDLYLTGRNRTPTHNHAVAVAAPLDGPDVDVPVAPYVLGAWLGDGTTVHADICQHVDDAAALIAELEAEGEPCTVKPGSRSAVVKICPGEVNGSGYCRRGHRRDGGKHGHCPECAHLVYRARRHGDPLPPPSNLPLRSRLIDVGVLGAKHIPDAYLRGSYKQRLALLQGLMDTDGSATRSGSVTLELHDERLARDAHRLIQSLGHKCALRVHHVRYRMAWTAPDPVFRLPRKRDAQRVVTSGASRNRYVVAVDPVESVPVRCIQVTGPSHLFLVGEACIATHNSLKAAEAGLVAKARDKMIHFGEAFEEVMRLAFMASDEDAPDGLEFMETEWADPEYHTEAARADATVKLHSAGIISTERAQKDMGYSSTERKQMQGELRRERLLAAAVTPPTPVAGPAIDPSQLTDVE